MEHPFYTAEEEWVNAGDLSLGEEILALDGSIGVVEFVEVVTDSQPMYNLTVADAHTFFVGDGQWLVHNAGGDDCERLYRAMTEDEYKSVLDNNGLAPRSRTRVSYLGVTETRAYPESLNIRHPSEYPVIVAFDVETGTVAKLQDLGAVHISAWKTFPDKPLFEKGSNAVQIKYERDGVLGYGLGTSLEGLNIFNSAIKAIRRIN